MELSETLHAHAEKVIREVDVAGWDIESVAYGQNVGEVPCVEVYIAQRTAVATGGLANARLVGWESPFSSEELPAFEWWIDAGPMTDRKTFVGRNAARCCTIIGTKRHGTVATELNHVWKTTYKGDVHSDLPALLGNPATTISVFALGGAFLGRILGQAGEDAYTTLKDVILRCTRARKTRPPSQRGDWSVLHDAELGTVIECPRDVPAEAALQLAKMTKTELRKRHLRWNPQTNAWDDIGNLSDPASPEVPPDRDKTRRPRLPK